METARVVGLILCALASGGAFVAAGFQHRQRGPILTNFPELGSAEKTDKSAAYRVARNVWLLVGAMFALLGIYVLFPLAGLFAAAMGCVALMVVYVIVQAVRSIKRI